MRSVYQDPEFAAYWDRVGHDSSGYKRFVVNPVMFKSAGSLRGKIVLELGCGNGVTVKSLFGRGAKKVIGLDLSAANLEHTHSKCVGKNLELLCQDATRQWKVKAASVDVIFSRMVLNEIRDLKSVLRQAARALRPRGLIVASVVHPALSLCDYVEGERAKTRHHVEGCGPYFERVEREFVINGAHHESFRVPYFHHTLQDYVMGFINAGFTLRALLEPEIGATALRARPKLIEVKDRPRSLVIVANRR